MAMADNPDCDYCGKVCSGWTVATLNRGIFYQDAAFCEPCAEDIFGGQPRYISDRPLSLRLVKFGRYLIRRFGEQIAPEAADA